MNPNSQPATPPAAVTSRTSSEAGSIVRAARLAAGMTLADLGHLCGYSASQISRYERGVQPLTDIILLRRLAGALAIRPQNLGLAAAEAGPTARHASTDKKTRPVRPSDPKVDRGCPSEDGEDPVRRRELLAAAAGLVGAAALNRSGTITAPITADLAGGLQDVIYSDGTVQPVTVSALRAATISARADFQAARYDRLASALPRLIATATATRENVSGSDRATASTMLADACIVTAGLMLKLNDDPLAWTMADRALQAAQAGDDPLSVADARRALATVMRRTGLRDRAHDLLTSAARDIEPSSCASPGQLSMYGTLLETAAYTAAVDGRRTDAIDLISEAKTAASRLGADANYRFTAFGPTNVSLYQVSIAQVLGDSGTAIEHAKTLRPTAIPTPERKGRYWIDVARAYHQWGKPEPCFRALLAAEQAAPAEVRYRPPVHRITEDLLRADRRRALTGLQAFASRIGMPVS
jgi:transcriptional regulator with XRE-family HTH domain